MLGRNGRVAGITAIGAVDLFAKGSTSIYYDDMSLEMGECTDFDRWIYLRIVLKD